MKIIFVQTLFLFLFVKVLLRDWRVLSIWDISYAVVSSLVSGWIFSVIGQYAALPLLGLVVLFTWWHTHSFSESLFVSLQVIIWSIVVDHISSLLTYMLKLDDGYLLIFMGLQLVGLITLNLILMNTHIQTTFNRPRLNRVTALLLLAIYDEYRVTIRAKYQVQQQRLQIKNDTRYMHEIETHYNELRRFRHDYQNIMLSINEYLKTDDLAGLQQYYQQNIAPVTKRVSDEQYNLEDLSRVQVKSVKSILFSKLSYAQSQGVKVQFDLKQVLNGVTTNELDLAIALGIILDNAIEATAGHYHGELMSAIFVTAHSTVFLVQNNVFDSLPPLWQLKEAGYSTKGQERGLGLSQLSAIVNRNENMILETRLLASAFVQRLTVKRE
ncbi:GHKL domain-containing protein [Lactiplantibacillus plantarum]|uniref:GHKL domain-containing protein n=1 Tax=Lactiplantibacillus plantarum TaxID=1590 RepID=UPI0027397CF0|nr:GHKL domain-containing protein [Lactiplantibacillus plantarum]MDP4437471.1 GHKL domain-containing protein [Lactiplantibacillus plantarum]MDP4440588.1 GHKL domain-containing protein [Lactiplantibacillus plantarum]MDP4459052.1 GHKL domain-containing protein [Lactiplantibacillus plantarum]